MTLSPSKLIPLTKLLPFISSLDIIRVRHFM